VNEYGKIRSAFWSRGTGKRLRGDLETQVVALYLMSCPMRHMTGLFYMPLPVLAHETGVPLEGASKALRRLAEEDFAHYDDEEELWFVPAMAREQIGARLAEKDKRHRNVVAALAALKNHRFVHRFHDLYGEAYELPPIGKPPDPPKQTARSTEAPSEPLRSQAQAQAHAQAQAAGSEGLPASSVGTREACTAWHAAMGSAGGA
jgi:hypothetical protein